jgi:hypothetical protein
MSVSDDYKNGAPFASPINCRGIGRRKLSRHQRVQLARDIAEGRVVLGKPTKRMIAKACGVRPEDLSRPLRNTRSLATQLVNASPSERLEAARALGVDVVWSEMVQPLLV